MTDILRDSAAVWMALREAGGLEVEGRDQDLGEKLRIQLDPKAPDIDAAITAASPDALLQALFQTVQPFVAMFSDILAFFKQANARHGQSQLRIRVAEEHLDLKHFEEFLSHWQAIRTEIDVPALGSKDAFILNDARNELDPDYRWSSAKVSAEAMFGADIADWLVQMEQGRYGPLPRSLQPDRLPDGLSDIAGVLSAALTIIQGQGGTRQDLRSLLDDRSGELLPDDALHPLAIAQNETDYWLRSHITHLAELMAGAQETRTAVSDRLVEFLKPFPRRRLLADLDVETFERLLSLPVWKRRHELYGVWVATRVVAALDDHDVTIQSDGDELRFAFRETILARIESARPKLLLITERRTPLADPVSPHRKDNVQPDFGLWTDAPSSECRLIIEVKHYKRRAGRNFREALIDYAAAHPRAQVLLVNYGPVGAPFSNLRSDVRDRCRMFGPMTPETVETLADFQEAVRDRAGAPVRTVSTTADRVAIDISGSMTNLFTTDVFRDLLETWTREDRLLALVDDTFPTYIWARDFAAWLAKQPATGGTDLAEPIRDLFRHDETVLVVTDAEGLESLAPLNPTSIPLDAISGNGLRLARIVRPPD